MSANKIVFGAECPDGMAWSVSPLDDNVGLRGYGGGMGRLPRASSDGWTIEVRCFLTAAPSLSHVFGFHSKEPSFYESVSSGARAGLLAYGGANSRNIYFWGESADLDSGVEWNIAGAPNHVIVTHAPGSSAVTFYIRIGTTTSIVSGSLSAALIDFTPAGIFTGSRHLSGSNPITGKLSKQAIYTECKTKEQALALLDNPWATLRGRRGTARSSTGGSGSNLAASGGSTATGTAQPAVSYSVVAAAVVATSGAAGPAAAINPQAIGLVVTSGAAQPSVSMTIAAAAVIESLGQAGVAPSVLLNAAGASLSSGNAGLAVVALAAAAGSAQSQGNAALSAQIRALAAGVVTVTGIANLANGDQQFGSAGGAVLTTGAAGATLAFTLAASGGSASSGFAGGQLNVALTAAGIVQMAGAGVLIVTAPLSAFGAVTTGGAANLGEAVIGTIVWPVRRLASTNLQTARRPRQLQCRR